MLTWTEEEVRILSENYNEVSNQELARLLPNKSAKGIYKKAYKMGLRKTADIEYLNRSEAAKQRFCNRVTERVTSKGYKQIYVPDHPRADKRGFVMEHIVVFEDATGVMVPLNCCVHHLNEDKQDNRPENLCMMENGAHTAFHHQGSKRSSETKELIAQKARERLADKRNHPRFKNIDVAGMAEMRASGATVVDICKAVGIDKTTYYRKMEEHNGS